MRTVFTASVKRYASPQHKMSPGHTRYRWPIRSKTQKAARPKAMIRKFIPEQAEAR